MKDKKRNILVMVTEEDIQKGIRGSPWYCPIALALKRYTKDRVGVLVGLSKANLFFIDKESISYQTKLPESAVEFILLFDKMPTIPPRPIGFELSLPTRFLRWKDEH